MLGISRQPFGAFMALTMVMLGLFSFLPSTFASATTFSSTPESEFNYNETDSIDFKVKMTDNTGDSTQVKFKIMGPLNENNEQTETIDTQIYNGNTTHTFSWDGELDGDLVEPGQYKAIFEGADNTLNYKFKVVNDDYNNDNDAEAILSFNPTPSSTYELESGEYPVLVKLSDYVNPTEVTVTVRDPDDDFVTSEEYTFKSEGTFAFYLDTDKFDDYEDGDILHLQVEGTDSNSSDTNVLSRSIEVVDYDNDNNNSSNNDGATLSFNPTPSSQYTLGSGDYIASVKLSDFDEDTEVRAYIKNKTTSQYTEVDDYEYTKNGTHTFYWNGKLNGKTVKAGDYQLRIYGEDDDSDETNILNHTFKVKTSSDSNSNNDSDCGNFDDVNTSDKNCDAIEWVQEQGIMTGQGGDNVFDPNGVVNRAQMAKIATLAYEEFDDSNDYCNGGRPFPDVQPNLWYSDYICRAIQLGMVTGYASGPDAGNYAPNKSVSVIEMFAILLRPLDEGMIYGESYSGLDNDEWYTPYARYAKNHLLYPGTFLSPTKQATRREVAQFLYELYEDGKISF